MRLLSSLAFIALWQPVQSQVWQPLAGGLDNAVLGLYADSASGKLYAVGQFYFADTNNLQVNNIAVWDGVKWDTLCYGVLYPWHTFAIYKYQNEIYSGGRFFGSSNEGGKFNGACWDSLGFGVDSQIVLVKDYLEMEVIGQTLDDAAGEAFDKAAKILGLPYPGGPLIDKFAKEGNPRSYPFPFPQMPGLDFSFSGLKTSFLYFIRDAKAKDELFIEKNKADICASIQYTIVEILLGKMKKAAAETGINTIALAGGVSANSGLRNAFLAMQEKEGWNVFIPPFEYCTDNAAMIAIAGHYKYLKGDFTTQGVTPLARMNL